MTSQAPMESGYYVTPVGVLWFLVETFQAPFDGKTYVLANRRERHGWRAMVMPESRWHRVASVGLTPVSGDWRSEGSERSYLLIEEHARRYR